MTANRAPLTDICCKTLAWSALLPFAYAWPQSPNTAKENGVDEPPATCEVNAATGR